MNADIAHHVMRICREFTTQEFELHCNSYEYPSLVAAGTDTRTAQLCKAILQAGFDWSCDGVRKYKVHIHAFEELPPKKINPIYLVSFDKNTKLGTKIQPEFLRNVISEVKNYLRSLASELKSPDGEALQEWVEIEHSHIDSITALFLQNLLPIAIGEGSFEMTGEPKEYKPLNIKYLTTELPKLRRFLQGLIDRLSSQELFPKARL